MTRRQWPIVLLLATAAGFLGGLLAGGAGEQPAGATITNQTLSGAYQPNFHEWLLVWGEVFWTATDPGRYDVFVRITDDPNKRPGHKKILLWARCRTEARADLDEALKRIKERIRKDIPRWKRYRRLEDSDFEVTIVDWPT